MTAHSDPKFFLVTTQGLSAPRWLSFVLASVEDVLFFVTFYQLGLASDGGKWLQPLVTWMTPTFSRKI